MYFAIVSVFLDLQFFGFKRIVHSRTANWERSEAGEDGEGPAPEMSRGGYGGGEDLSFQVPWIDQRQICFYLILFQWFDCLLAFFFWVFLFEWRSVAMRPSTRGEIEIQVNWTSSLVSLSTVQHQARLVSWTWWAPLVLKWWQKLSQKLRSVRQAPLIPFALVVVRRDTPRLMS